MRKMIVRSLNRAALLAFCLLTAACTVNAEPILKPGEKMVFLGDSITEQRIHTRYVMNYFAMRFPGQSFSFRNAGWGGDTSPGGLNRLQRDVLSLKPNIVSICFGMNDGRYTPFDQGNFNTYMQGMSGLVSELKKAGVKVILLTPGCVDPDRNKGIPFYNDTLAQFAKGVKDLAASENVPVFDIHSLMLDVQTKAKSADSNFTMIPDGIHPNPAGQVIMAYGLLQMLGCSDSASGLAIDAKKSTYSTDRCSVSDLKVSKRLITFTRKDEALPVGFDDEVAGILKYAPFVSEMNAYKFKVTGLRKGTWKLNVQGSDVGEFTADALANGVDLSSQPGPWVKLGQDVNTLSFEQESDYFVRWRQVQLAGFPEQSQSKVDDLCRWFDTTIDSKEAARNKAAVNRAWEWTLSFVR